MQKIFKGAQKLAADVMRGDPSQGVHINCSVAGLVVLVLPMGQLPVQLVVGAMYLPYGVMGYTAAGSSGTFTVYALS